MKMNPNSLKNLRPLTSERASEIGKLGKGVKRPKASIRRLIKTDLIEILSAANEKFEGKNNQFAMLSMAVQKAIRTSDPKLLTFIADSIGEGVKQESESKQMDAGNVEINFTDDSKVESDES